MSFWCIYIDHLGFGRQQPCHPAATQSIAVVKVLPLGHQLLKSLGTKQRSAKNHSRSKIHLAAFQNG
ncbi:MAG: hypothetical protein DRG40_02765 [Deltaproteobacteria bacterium]|nr:MAG: hypothetical protein DRG40_02765 [Deltaproteobacteria bacterium]